MLRTAMVVYVLLNELEDLVLMIFFFIIALKFDDYLSSHEGSLVTDNTYSNNPGWTYFFW